MAAVQPLAHRENEVRGRFAKACRDYFWGIAFLLPAILVFCMFLWTPIAKGIVYSFMHVDFVNGSAFVGWDNYRTVLASADLGMAVRNTLYYMLLGVLIGFWVPSLVAIAVSELRRGQGAMRLIVYLPNIVPAVVLYGMWQWLYDPLGPANQILSWFGGHQVLWLTDKHVAMLAIVIAETWQGFGSAALIYLAGIVGIPKDLYEAAEIDGAGVLQRIRYITIPGIRHLYVLLFILQLIGTSQGFLTHVALTGGGPNIATLTYMYKIINEAFTSFNYGTASALGVMMFLVLTTLSIVLYYLQGRSEKA
ncbi:carbohydrate ABC transporter permease [Cohnella nanjingensis]|uniref:Sugar ABC transporter permease n=1 Tax=Cohnella nanjingensis TaxID=1387779 RepID=A0A7X0RNY2_9BACL|nr:sugar ABC transporter permease [Cohnella nanjingensis]MBB6670982.1 sugar ABC transporter permease [Cohnella nanjingensis]